MLSNMLNYLMIKLGRKRIKIMFVIVKKIVSFNCFYFEVRFKNEF